MEEQKKSKNQTKSADEEKIVELSADMALADQSKHKIIDLKENIENTADRAKTPPEPTSAKADIVDFTNTKETNDAIEEESPTAIEDDTIETSNEDEKTDKIEDEIDTAFDMVAVQQPESTDTKTDDFLLDELSDIPQKVDDTVSKFDADGEDQLPFDVDAHDEQAMAIDPLGADDVDELDIKDQFALDPDPFDEGALAIDPTDLETALSDDEDDIFGHANSTEDTALEAGFDMPEEADDEIIELVDIADPAELEALGIEAEKNDEIIELTNVVDLSELESLDNEITDSQEIAKATELQEPTKPYDTLTDAHDEEELSLSDHDDSSDLLEQIDDISSSEVVDELFDDDILNEHDVDVQDEDVAPIENIEEAQEQDQVIQLSDVINNIRRQDKPEDQNKIQTKEALEDQEISSETKSASESVDAEPADDPTSENAERRIEAAVEHIIQTKYADRIEKLIASAVEKAVTREIENIRRTLSDDERSG